MRRCLLIAVLACVSLAARTGHANPLDLSLVQPRHVLVEFENSCTSPGTIATSWGTPVRGFYSVSNGMGTVEIASKDWGDARAEATGEFAGPGTFESYVFHIDLMTGEATSEFTQVNLKPLPEILGVWSEHHQQPLATDATAGFTGPAITTCGFLFCSSGPTCNLVEGLPYNPVTGTLNMVGEEDVVLCDGTCAFHYTSFALYGDIRISEGGIGVPVLGPVAYVALGLALMLTGAARARPRRRGPDGI